MDSKYTNGHPSPSSSSNGIPITVRNTSESFPLEEITHFSRGNNYTYSAAPTNSLNSINVTDTRHSSEDYSSEPLSVGGVGATSLAKAQASTTAAASGAAGNGQYDSDDNKYAFGSSSSEDDEVTQYHRYDRITAKPSAAVASSTSAGSNGFPSQHVVRPAISDDNFPTILNSNAVVTKSDVSFALLTLCFTVLNFGTDTTLVFWHYANGHGWYSAVTAIIMMLGACSILHQFGIIDMERLRRIFDDAKRVRILTNCLPTCGTIVSSYYLTKTGLKAKTNQMFALQFFSHEEFLQNLLRIQSVFQAAPQATLQLLIFMETGHQMSFAKGLFLFINILTSLIIMTIGNLPNRTEEFDSALSPGAYNPTARLFIALRMFSSFASRIMGIVYILIGINCLLDTFSSVATFESFLISFSVILVPRLCFTFADFGYRRLRVSSPKNANVTCCRVFVGYLATVFFPMSDPLWIFWYIWFETILFILFGNIVGWFNATECITNLVNTIYTGTFIVLFIVIPIFLPFARATVKRRQLKRLENIFDRSTNRSTGSNSRSMHDRGGGYNSQVPETSFSVTNDNAARNTMNQPV